MGFRFNKKIKIAKGVNLNLSKKGISTSVKFGNVTANSRGRVTTNLGNGLSHQINLKSKKINKKRIDDTNEIKLVKKWNSFLLCLFLGIFGAHKFYEGKFGQGILYLFTAGLFCIGWIIDIISILFKSDPYYV